MASSTDIHKTDLDPKSKLRLAEIDSSMKGPCLFFISASIIWLIIGTLFALIASISLHSPNHFPAQEWLSFGIMRSAHLNVVAFGWLNNVVYAVGLWIMARLCRVPLKYNWLLFVAGIFWNLGVVIGVAAIFNGHMTSVEWLEMPKNVAPLLALSYGFIGVWGIVSFKFRKGEHVYVSQWYILAALFWFPWLYTIAQILIFWFPARGTIQALTNWWFGHNVLGLWYTPMGVAATYYFIPKVLGKPIHSYYLSVIGFWTLAFFYNWAGVHHLIGGPIPVWFISAGIVASVMMVIPVVVTAINHHLTVVGSFHLVWASPTLRFIVFGAMSYTVSSLLGSTMALREVNMVTHFTQFTVGHAHQGAYAFVTMVMFGSIYFMVPRLLQKEWPSARLISIHFWGTAIGITIYIVALHIGGWIQGLELNNADIPFLEVVRHLVPWLVSRSVGGVFILVGHIAFFINFFWMLFRSRRLTLATGPTTFSSMKNQGVSA
ncbi:MAG: hypothetical protein COZ46_05015 [Verrucomicrobia bacterium CG_4_10_14_3_um_filter_43_23]|nr:MAG: hypothetical protein AUJ82_05355 [Verrucomicrobia bacterium CG1_02_43_26]PIP58753.1 MAG: hypothetical protein COX01_06995 [Verrucomicrobia bacterium CG22_combo_CG10-13_8_21_14_all_43_17]PIX58201.1 MAG: hypothetical protein COZ46_05015 [Verrucomicrobia bacterium CG_4_10_14_3_um_filter_43_23]PIY61536.1 MAG: hypothetical protein COY94_05010 [Verrucomicrobia bacterium CG_4_10_14_0_8_um_filter_43_34]PJA44396.1 MAG: hypothetical protein CO175_03030 [Verrucomicrobia bacterium CG_4_9_14_3_um_fi